MKKIFIIKKKPHRNSRQNWSKQNTASLILIYIRQLYTTLLLHRGLEILIKVIYAHFKIRLYCQNSDSWATDLLRVTAVNIGHKILTVHVFVTSV